MLKLHTQRHIELAFVEKPTYWVVYALFLETTAGETIEVRAPKFLKIVQKKIAALAGSFTRNATLALASARASQEAPAAIASPYSNFVRPHEPTQSSWYFARPPTRA